MDCRTFRALAFGLFLGGAGCLPHGALPLTASKPEPPDAKSQEVELTNHPPKASAYVAFGNLHMDAAADPNRPASDREQLYEQARKAYQQALTLDPKDVPALTALGRLYSAKGDCDRAVATYQKALQVRPKDAVIWYELGMCQARFKQWEPAVKSLRNATECDRDNPQYGNALGFTLARTGHYQEAFVAFRKVNGEADSHLRLARMLYQVKEEELSRRHLLLALEANPQLNDAKDLLVKIENPAAAGYSPDQSAGRTAENPRINRENR